jgi:hypothetical protein
VLVSVFIIFIYITLANSAEYFQDIPFLAIYSPNPKLRKVASTSEGLMPLARFLCFPPILHSLTKTLRLRRIPRNHILHRMNLCSYFRTSLTQMADHSILATIHSGRLSICIIGGRYVLPFRPFLDTPNSWAFRMIWSGMILTNVSNILHMEFM